MKEPTFCDYCGQRLELGREFVYQLEMIQEIEDPRLQGLVDEHSLTADGEPLRVCELCRQSIDDNLQALIQEEEDGDTIPIGGRYTRFTLRWRPSFLGA
jgi:hypothetical protein